MVIFLLKLPVILQKNKIMLAFYSEIKSKYSQIFRKTILKNKFQY